MGYGMGDVTRERLLVAASRLAPVYPLRQWLADLEEGGILVP